MKSGDCNRTSRRWQAGGLTGVDNGISIAALDIQLRVACIDGQIHAVRHLLEQGAGPFRIVCTVISAEISIFLVVISYAIALTSLLIAFQKCLGSLRQKECADGCH